jgi:anaerobic glycerol-3-phosphate dehydrogenase
MAALDGLLLNVMPSGSAISNVLQRVLQLRKEANDHPLQTAGRMLFAEGICDVKLLLISD